MRIAIATDAWHPQINGVVTTLSRTAAELEKLGHEVLMITPAEFRTIACPTYPEIRLALRPRRLVGRKLEALSPDAIHVATEGPIGLAARGYCMNAQQTFTTSLHTRFPEYVRLRLPVPLSWGYRYLRWFHAPAWRTMVSVPSLREELEQRGLQDLVIWSRGVDLDVFEPRDRGFLPGKRPIFMYMGRVAVEKNVEMFLRLDLPGSQYVVGGGPDLESLQRRYPKACFTGYKVGVDLARHVASADVMVFPSKTDTFGLTILEAMACGVPVAAFPVQGPRDLIQNGYNGWTDPDLRTAALACLAVNPADCREFATRYSWAVCTEQFLSHLCAN
ncbi:MAG: glycosyltransferase family 4 protein [Gammaproteobacteria bacterium]